MNIIKRNSKDNLKTFYTIEWGRGQGERIATGIYTYIRADARKSFKNNVLSSKIKPKGYPHFAEFSKNG